MPTSQLLSEIRKCELCKAHLPNKPNPILAFSPKSKIVIVGQAPGRVVDTTNIPWNDESGKSLRKWLGVSNEEFYNSDNFALLPMGFCYPGTGKSGDLPPRKECAETWHKNVFEELKEIKLILLIGNYAQKHYLKDKAKRSLTQNVMAYEQHLPLYLPLPHPSPRNRFWLKKNPWFENEVLPRLKQHVLEALIS
jgi:uracil-DNA glycosylase family 4